jgi:hypothetical protein
MGRTGWLDPTALLIQGRNQWRSVPYLCLERHLRYLLLEATLLTAVSEPPLAVASYPRIPLRSPSCCFNCILVVAIVDLEPQLLLVFQL